MEEVRGGELRERIQLGGYESKLCLRVIRGIHSADSVEKHFLNGNKRWINIPEFVQNKLLFATVGLMITPYIS